MVRQALGVLVVLGVAVLAGTTFQEKVPCSECAKVQNASNRFCENCGKPMEHFKFLELMAKAKDQASRNEHRIAAATYIQAASRKVGNAYKAQALVGAGKCLFELKDYQPAGKELAKSLTLDPSSHEANLLLGRIELEVNKNPGKAKEHLLAANRLAGDETVAALWLADIALDEKNLTEALRLYQLAEKRNPEMARIQYLVAMILDSTGGSSAEIEARLKRAREIDPSWFDPPYLLAQRLMKWERYAEAAVYFSVCAAMRPQDAQLGLRTAQAYRLARDIPGSRAALERVLRSHPRNYAALLGLARIAYLHDKDIKAAEDYLERARAIAPNNPDIQFFHRLMVDIRDTRKEISIVTEFNCDRAAAWSPTGDQIAFQSDRGKKWDIYSLKIGGKPVKLTSEGDNGDPAWSPDGTKIAYHSNRGSTEIYVMDADGKNPRALTNSKGRDESPCWSPDGKLIAFASNRENSNNFDIYVMNADGTNLRRITSYTGDDIQPRFSPDGNRIIYVSQQSGHRNIYTIDLMGGSPRRLTNEAVDHNWPSYSPDGRYVLFSSKKTGKHKLVVMNADGSDPIPVTSNESDEIEGAWNPNGVRILCTTGKVPTVSTFDIKSYISPKRSEPSLKLEGNLP